VTRRLAKKERTVATLKFDKVTSVPSLLYGVKTRVIPHADRNTLQAREMRFRGSGTRCGGPNKIYYEIREEINTFNISENVYS
jgi:hypothetical protein